MIVSQQGCRLSLRQEFVLVHLGDLLLQEVPLPLLEQILSLALYPPSAVAGDSVSASGWK